MIDFMLWVFWPVDQTSQTYIGHSILQGKQIDKQQEWLECEEGNDVDLRFVKKTCILIVIDAVDKGLL